MSDIPESLSAALANRYRIERELGSGGMATVYLAVDLRHDRKVAIKVLRPELAAVIGAERFLAEIKTTANLQHPHILPLHDSGTVNGTVFYVMPFVQGESLRDRLNREKQLPIDESVRIVREVASALDYAHRHGIIHRDIKPENILLHDGQAIVADFGIALAASSSGRMTETGMSLGTPHYMSPEQAMGERNLDARTDVYAMGCVLYELLTGEPPFTGPTAQAIVAKVLTDEPRPVSQLRKTVPSHIDAVIITALAKLPADRFASAAEFAQALTDTSSVNRYVPRATAAIRSKAPRSPVLVALAGLLVVALAVFAGFSIRGWMSGNETTATSRQHIVLEKAGGGSYQSSFVGASISPDGQTIVFGDTARGTTQLWSKNRDELEATPLAGTKGALGSPFFSPNGSWIAFGMSNGSLFKVPRSGGTAIRIAGGANVIWPVGAWLTNGTIVFNDTTFRMMSVADTGGAVHALEDIPGVVRISPLPDPNQLLYIRCSSFCVAGIELRIMDLVTGKSRKLLDETVAAWMLGDGRLVYIRRDGGVSVARIDLANGALSGATKPVIEGVRTDIAGMMHLSMASKGTLLYATGAGGTIGPSQIYLISRTGARIPIDSGWSPIISDGSGLELAPDARKVLLTIDSDSLHAVWVKELRGGPLSRLTPDAGTGNIGASWTPDGQSITFVADSSRSLYVRPADASAPARPLFRIAKRILGARWSRDGRTIVGWAVDSLGARRLWQFHPGVDTVPGPLADTGANMWSASLSPDGHWLAYVSDETGRPEAYVVPYPNTSAGRWPVSVNGGAEPIWAHNGREIFYRSYPGTPQKGEFMVAAVKTTPPFSVISRRPLFPDPFHKDDRAWLYDVTPDDQQFLLAMFNVAGEFPLNLVLVENWLRKNGN